MYIFFYIRTYFFKFVLNKPVLQHKQLLSIDQFLKARDVASVHSV